MWLLPSYLLRGTYLSPVGSIRRCWIPEVSTWFCISYTSQPQNECHFCYGLLILTRYNTLNVCYLSQENAIPFTMMLLDISGSCLVSFIFKGEQKVKEITWEPTLTFKERMAKLFEITLSQDSSVTLERTLSSGTTSWRANMVGFFPQQDSLEDTGANAEEKQGLIVGDTDNV